MDQNHFSSSLLIEPKLNLNVLRQLNHSEVFRAVLVPQQECLIHRSDNVGQHSLPRYLGFALSLQPGESESVDAALEAS